jgi:hypothetical protein
MRFDRCIATLLFILLPVAAAAETKEPTGYGKASFGASVEEVEKAYPELSKLAEDKSLGAPIVGGPHITRYALHDQKLEGVSEPVTVELRFWKEKFWLYIVYFGKDHLDPVVAHLTNEYGKQTGPDPAFPIWNLGKATIMVETKTSRYTVNDEALSNEARAWFVEAFNARGGQQLELVDEAAKTESPGAVPSPSPAKPE